MIHTNEGSLGPYKYKHIYIRGMGHQIQWTNPPPKGTKVLHGRKVETVDEIGVAGMIYHTDKRGFQSASFPSDLRLLWKIATSKDSDRTGYCRGCGTTIGEAHHFDCELM